MCVLVKDPCHNDTGITTSLALDCMNYLVALNYSKRQAEAGIHDGHVCVFRFLVCSLTLSNDDRPAMPVAFSLSSFLLRSVCPSVCITVVSDAVHWPARLQNRLKIIVNIDRKSIHGEAPGHPKSTKNRFLDPLGTNRGAPERPEGISGASRERLGSVSGCPQCTSGVPGGSPRAPLDGRKIARERPGARRGHQNRRQVASRNENFEFSWHGSLADWLWLAFRLRFARFSDVRASRSGSALAANFDRFPV